jgi:hypothetical protein
MNGYREQDTRSRIGDTSMKECWQDVRFRGNYVCDIVIVFQETIRL